MSLTRLWARVRCFACVDGRAPKFARMPWQRRRILAGQICPCRPLKQQWCILADWICTLAVRSVSAVMRWTRREVWLAGGCGVRLLSRLEKPWWLHGMNQLAHGRLGSIAGQGTAKATPPGTSISSLEMKCIPKDVTCLWCYRPQPTQTSGHASLKFVKMQVLG